MQDFLAILILVTFHGLEIQFHLLKLKWLSTYEHKVLSSF